MNYVFGQWGPTYFVELGVARSEIGAWLALPGTVSVWGAFLIGWLEGRAIRGGMSQLRLRRVFTQVCTSQPNRSWIYLPVFERPHLALAALVSDPSPILCVQVGSACSALLCTHGSRPRVPPNSAPHHQLGHRRALEWRLLLPSSAVALDNGLGRLPGTLPCSLRLSPLAPGDSFECRLRVGGR